MKKYVILFLLLSFSICYADGWYYSKSVTAATPQHSYALDAAGGAGSAQVYDSIATSWKGGGADTVSFASGYLEADSTSDRCYVPGTDFDYNVVTIEFEYQVSNVEDSNLYPFNISGSGDEISFRHFVGTDTGRVAYRANYGTEVTLNFSNVGLAVNTWYKVYIVIDVTGNDVYVYVNGTLVASSVDNANVVDPGTLDNAYIGYIASGTNVVRMKNLKVYNESVTP